MNPLVTFVRRLQHSANDPRIRQHNNRYSIFTRKDIPYLNDGSEYHLLDVYSPDGSAEMLPVIVEVHGGGYVSCYKEVNRPHAQYLASKGFHVVNINYTLYPEADFRGAVQEIYTVLQWISDHREEYGFDTDNVFMTGDSAGGHLVLCTARAMNFKESAGFFGVGESPLEIRAFALTCPAGDMIELSREDNMALKLLMRASGNLLKDRSYQNEISYHTLPGIPFPLLILTSEQDDLLYAHTKSMHVELSEKGFSHEYREYEGKWNHLEHVFNVLYPDYPESRLANEDMIDFFLRNR